MKITVAADSRFNVLQVGSVIPAEVCRGRGVSLNASLGWYCPVIRSAATGGDRSFSAAYKGIQGSEEKNRCHRDKQCGASLGKDRPTRYMGN